MKLITELKKHIISELLSFDTFLGDLYSQIIEIDPRAEIITDNNEKVIAIDNIIIQVTTEFDNKKEPKYVIYEYDKKNPSVVKNKFLSTTEVLSFIKTNIKTLTSKEIMKENMKLYEVYEDLRKSGKFSTDYGNYKPNETNVTWNQITINNMFIDKKSLNQVIITLNDDSKVTLTKGMLSYCEPRFIRLDDRKIYYEDIKSVK